MQRLTGWLGRGASFILFKSPPFVRMGLAYLLAFLWFDLFRIRRQVVLANIRLAFPEKTEKERVRIGRDSLRQLGLNFVEYCYLPWMNARTVEQEFEFEGLDIFERALAQKKGVLLLTLHLGHGDLSTAALAVRGYPMVMVSKAFKLQWLNDMWFGMREKIGMRFVPARNGSFALLKALKKNQAVIIPLDQFTGPPIGVRTKFFGVETGTAAGLSLMAQRSGAPVVSVYTYRKPNGKHVVHFVREVPSEGTAERVTQGFNDELETFVRKHPEQWMWLHRRWKRFVE